MRVTWRVLLLTLAVIAAAVGLAIAIRPSGAYLAWIIVICGLGIALLLNIFQPRKPPQPVTDSDDITQLDDERRAELVRGTSMQLRDMKYRYSVRHDNSNAGDRRPFTADVNTIRLGFIPVFIIDNNTDRQGLGYMAFVHDGQRWRGPGLPCPAEQSEAVRHAARCVSPLATEDDTRY
jgi:hypothetical protein